jgi:hypothetical protein
MYASQDVPYIWIEENPRTGYLDQFAQRSPSVENVEQPLPPWRKLGSVLLGHGTRNSAWSCGPVGDAKPLWAKLGNVMLLGRAQVG